MLLLSWKPHHNQQQRQQRRQQQQQDIPAVVQNPVNSLQGLHRQAALVTPHKALLPQQSLLLLVQRCPPKHTGSV
jgi:hypothetical protein